VAADQSVTATPAGDPTAVIPRRIIAWLVDLVSFVAFAIVVALALGRRHAGIACKAVTHQRVFTQCLTLGHDAWVVSGARFWLATLLAAGWFVAVFGVLQGHRGASPGKLLTGLRVVGPEGAAIGTTRSLVRSLCWAADGFPYLLGPVVGGVAMVSSRGHRRLGDLAADSYVVAADAAGRPVLQD
jgi:uncharacterized RDD family membrane protein YckC